MTVGNMAIPKMHLVKGIKIGVTEAYVRYPNRKDLVVFEVAKGSQVAGVFTQNTFCAAPVQVCRENLKNDIRYLVINTGNANAATGNIGLENTYKTCSKLAELAQVKAHEILPFSTGVIGEQLPIERLEQGLAPALQNLKEDAWVDAAYGIMTTDTSPKGASEQFEIDGIQYTITGISKGAGMIRPNMATMLGFVATDLPIQKNLLQKMLKNAVDQSFNRITVDGDTSTNDSCILISTGTAGGVELTTETDHRYQIVTQILNRVMKQLAQLIIRDGEGATKFITVHVSGGQDTQECCDVAYSIAHSPLVKTAIFASDPNWGRIICAIGNAKIKNLDASRVQVWLDDVQICENGGLAENYTEELGAGVMEKSEITIHVNLGRGQAEDTVYTCDLSYDYVKINADYRS